MYMLDTNICIFALKHNPKVLAELKSKFKKGIFISSISLAELEFGICNSQSQIKNRNALIAFLPIVEVLQFDELAAAEYGRIRADLQKSDRVIGGMDMLIAAHAKSSGMILVTNSTRDFKRVERLVLEDWV